MKSVVWLLLALIGAATLVLLSGADPKALISQAYDFVTVNRLMLVVGAAVLIAVRFVYTLPRTH